MPTNKQTNNLTVVFLQFLFNHEALDLQKIVDPKSLNQETEVL